MTSLVLITGNQSKAAEYSRLLGIEVSAQKVPLPEVQALDVEEVASAKAQAAFDAIKRPVIVDDSGISFDAWVGLPGALTSWFMDTVGNEGLIRMLDGFDNRQATVKTAIGYCDSSGARAFVGEVRGFIAREPRGSNGFGYDPIFVPSAGTLTFAEMSDGEKDLLSMRALACHSLLRGMNGGSDETPGV